ncbi:MAG: hypothetical protein AAGD09_11435 [Cyanobacteria bacterium P01_F01_bin.56]
MASQADRLAKAIAWYEANCYEIVEALPLDTLPWVVIQRNAAIHIDRSIEEYKAGRLRGAVAGALLQQLRRLYRAFERSKEG